MSNLLNTVAVAHGDRVFFHNVLDLRYRRIGDQSLERKHASEALIVVDHVNVVDFVHLLSLFPHLVDTFGHAPVLVDNDHLGTHQTTGGVFVVFQQVNDIAGLLNILDMRKDFLLRILVELTHQVDGVVGFHVIDEPFRDQLIRKLFQQLVSIFLVEFHQYIGRLLAIHKKI